MYNYESDATLTGCTFEINTAFDGGGMYNGDSSPTLINCEFENNTAANDGGGMYNDTNSSPEISDTVFCNTPSDIDGPWTDHGGNCMTYDCDGCVPPQETCDADLDGDGEVKVADLLLLIGAWGACPAETCDADLDGDGEVKVADLLLLIGAWGACP
jgi:hypothetical protein